MRVTKQMTDQAVIQAIIAAGDWFRQHNVALSADLYERLRDALRVEMTAAWGEAVADMQEAIDAHMPQIAGVTFGVSMRLAGIKAAKRALATEGGAR